jgi:hypothetical protein
LGFRISDLGDVITVYSIRIAAKDAKLPTKIVEARPFAGPTLMRVKRKSFITFGISIASTAILLAQESPQERHQRNQQFMRTKLSYAQAILEGLTLENYGLITTNTALMRSMNLTNTFLELGNPCYRNEIANFQRSVDRLQKAAERKELWQSYEEYNRVAQSCVRCHQQFRRDQYVRASQARARQ